jgi:hypothetical protein
MHDVDLIPIFLIIILFTLVALLFKEIISKQNTTVQGKQNTTVQGKQTTTFQVKCDEITETIEDQTFSSDQEIKILKIKIKGMIKVPTPNYPVVFAVSLIDVYKVTEEKKPVLTTINAFQMKEGMEFLYVSDMSFIPHQQSIIDDWVDFLKIPIDGLISRKKGEGLSKYMSM